MNHKHLGILHHIVAMHNTDTYVNCAGPKSRPNLIIDSSHRRPTSLHLKQHGCLQKRAHQSPHQCPKNKLHPRRESRDASRLRPSLYITTSCPMQTLKTRHTRPEFSRERPTFPFSIASFKFVCGRHTFPPQKREAHVQMHKAHSTEVCIYDWQLKLNQFVTQ